MTHTLKLDSHCAQTGCSCTHDYCYKGWIDSPTGTHTTPCPYCRESLSNRLHRVDQARAKGYPQAALYRISTKVTQ
jgi:hypothetical protein